MITVLKHWLGCRSGATAIEYSLIAAGIAISIVAAVFLLGDDMAVFFEEIAEGLDGDV